MFLNKKIFDNSEIPFTMAVSSTKTSCNTVNAVHRTDTFVNNNSNNSARYNTLPSCGDTFPPQSTRIKKEKMYQSYKSSDSTFCSSRSDTELSLIFSPVFIPLVINATAHLG